MQTSTHPCLFSSRSLSAKSAFGNATATDSNKANQGDITTPCPAVSPKVPFLYTTATSSVGHVKCSSRTLSHPPTPPDDHKRACATCSQRHNKFRGPCIMLVRNVITHPTAPPMTIREHVQHVNSGSKFREPCVIHVKNGITPPPFLMTIREHVQYAHNGKRFRGPCIILVRNVITPPHPA